MPLTVQRLRRLERWSSWAADAGERVYVIPDATNVVAVSNISLSDKLTFSVPLGSRTSAQMYKGTVLRLDQDDVTFDEWKIVGRADDTQAGLAQITAAPFATTDLVTGDFVSRLDSDGTRNYEFESVGLSPTAQIAQWILPATPSFVTIGTVTPVAPMDMTYGWDKPIAALQRMAATVGMELQVRRVGSVGYAIDLIPEIGYGAATCDLRVGKNIRRLARSISADGQATRVYPKGQATDGVHATMAEAAWLVASVASVNNTTVVTLADPAGGDGPIAFDNQLASGASISGGNVYIDNGDPFGGIWLRTTGGATYLIGASSAVDQTVTLQASVTGIAAGDVIDFRTGAAGSRGNELTWLDSPLDVATWGVLSAPLDAGDIPGHRNLVRNSALRDWAQGNTLPALWNAVNAPTIALQTAAPYVLAGASSIKATTTIDGQGVVTIPVRIDPSQDNPYVSAFGSVWVVSGTVRAELVFTTPGVGTGTIVQPILPSVASNQYSGQWEDLGLAGIDARALGATSAALRIVQHGQTPAVFYVGRAQITNSPSQLPFVEGSGGTKLWQAANDQLRSNAAPTVAYEVAIVDLAALDPQTWGPNSTVTVGGSVLVTDPKFPLQILTRFIELTRTYGNASAVVTISSKPDDLSGSYGRPKKKGRISPAFFSAPDAPTISAVTAAINTQGNPSILIIATPDAQSLKIAVSTAGIPADSTVEATAPIAGNQAVVSFLGLNVQPGQTLYGKTFAYRGDNGDGLRSPPMPFSIPFAAIRRDAPWADGGYALAASDTSGLVANSGVTDSSGLASRRVNLTLAKASQGAPDDLRSVPDGGGYNKTTSSFVDSTGRVITIARPATGGTLTGDVLGSKTDNLDNLGLAYGSQIAGAPVENVSRSGGVVWQETFNKADALSAWTRGGSGVVSLSSDGDRNYAVMDGPASLYWNKNIPFDPTKEYRMRLVATVASYGSAGVALPMYVGFLCVASDGVTVLSSLGQRQTWPGAAGPFSYVVWNGETFVYANFVWITQTGYFRGFGTPTGEAQNALYPTPVTAGTVYIRPLILANYGGPADARVLIDNFSLDVLDERGTALTYGGFSGVGTIGSGVTQGDPAGGRVMLRGRQTGTCRNGDVINFTPPFQNTPVVNFHGGALNEPRNRWGALGDGSESAAPAVSPQYEVFAARNLSASGFTADARLRQKSSVVSAVRDNWANSSTVANIGTGTDKTGTSTGSLAPSGAPSSNGTYSVDVSSTIGLQYDPTIGGAQSFSVTVAVDVDSTGTGAWAQSGTYTFIKSGTTNGSSTYSTTVNVTRSGLTSSSQFRARIVGYADHSAGSSGSVTATALRYQRSTGTADQYASKTPDADDVVNYEAYEASLS